MAILASRFEGRSINILKQSIITATFLPNDALKHSGIVFCKESRSGQWIKPASLVSASFSHFRIIFDTVPWQTPKWYAKPSFGALVLSFYMRHINSWKLESLVTPLLVKPFETWSSIMAFSNLKFGNPVWNLIDLLFLKLCRHNRHKPSYVHMLQKLWLRRLNTSYIYRLATQPKMRFCITKCV